MNRARPRYSSKPHNVTMNGCSPRRVISHPWIQPSSAPSASMISTAAGQATCHSVSIIDSSTPSRANADPTDRSMPPVMITRPSPRLKIPNAPISRAVFWRFAADTKRGLSAVTIAHNTTSSRNVASSFFTSRRFYRHLGLGVVCRVREKGVPDWVIRAQFGHLSPAMMAIYSHVRRKALDDAAHALEPDGASPMSTPPAATASDARSDGLCHM